MLNIILGGAGSGKSSLLTDQMAQDVAAGRRAWLIIPEQQANLSERTILPKLPHGSGLTFRVVGFTRLAREVAAACGSPSAMPLSPALKSLFMWQNLREMNGLLQQYGTVSPRSDAHLTSLLLKTIDELRQNAITPTRLDRDIVKLPKDHPLRAKLNDLSLLYVAYENMLSQAYDGEPYDEISQLAQLLKQHNYFAGGHVYIDSFTSFTAEEYAVLRAILLQAENVTITLCLDETLEHQPSQDSLLETYRRLLRLCEDTSIACKETHLRENHRAKAKELQILERQFWNLALTEQNRPNIAPNEQGAITMLRCSNLYAEAEATALHILDLVHRGYRYGDIAVIVRDAATYRGVLDAAMERYGIPFYFSEKTSLSNQPLARLLLSALRAVSYGWQAQDILAMLKTGLCPLTADQIDHFEQYVSTWNLTGAAFAATRWVKNPDGYTDKLSERGHHILADANLVRETIMTPLLRLYSATAGERPLPELCEALYDLMQQFHLSQGCAALAEKELAFGYLKQAGETVRTYDTVVQTLTQISARLPDAVMDIDEFCTALSMVFEQTEIASVPSLHDSVTIGSADTLRVENITVSFLLGMNEGEFPKAVSDEGLLRDDEKQLLCEIGIPLDTRSELRAANELLFVWRAMTKPSERLFASTLLAATDGKEKSPSVAYNRLLFLFPYLKEKVRSFDLSMIAGASYNLMPEGSEENATSPSSPAPIAATPTDELYQPLPPSDHDLSHDIVSQCFGKDIWLSKSKIQTFVQCPYSYYCTYHLSPRERKAARIEASDSGTFLHYFLEHFLRHCLDEQGTLRLPEESQVAPLADELVNGYLSLLSGVTSTDLRTIHVFRRLRALALLLLRDILYELSHSRFVPHDFEVKIGRGPSAAIGPYEITLKDNRKILLDGVIDRVDFFRRGDDIYIRIIDYKSSTHTISLSDIRKGLDLQLFLYLFTYCRAKNVLPAGAMFVATAENGGKPTANRTGLLIKDEDILSAINDEWNPSYLAGISRNTKGELKGNALTSPEILKQLESDINETLRRIGTDMLNGRAARTPSEDACRFCPVKNGCSVAIHPKKY